MVGSLISEGKTQLNLARDWKQAYWHSHSQWRVLQVACSHYPGQIPCSDSHVNIALRTPFQTYMKTYTKYNEMFRKFSIWTKKVKDQDGGVSWDLQLPQIDCACKRNRLGLEQVVSSPLIQGRLIQIWDRAERRQSRAQPDVDWNQVYWRSHHPRRVSKSCGGHMNMALPYPTRKNKGNIKRRVMIFWIRTKRIKE